MISQELVARINQLVAKQKAGTLTPEEKIEQDQLRKQYLQGIKAQIVDSLEASGFKKSSDSECGCGHHHHQHSNCGCGHHHNSGQGHLH
ncbi:MAG: DUF896 domain-containing protein [Clostridia bacterium]|nr:DUF896 domain-containing protein [Clostridia bacterium]